jgi:hypothetical protein
MIDWMIDDPEFSAPVAVWKAWLEKLRNMPEEHKASPSIQSCIARAEKVIPRREEIDREFAELGLPPLGCGRSLTDQPATKTGN